MKTSYLRALRLGAASCLVILAMTMPISSLAGDKIRPEEIVSKHLDSIGAAETRGSVHSRIVGGTAVVFLHSPGTARLTGKVMMTSAGSKNMLGTTFDASAAFQDRFGFDGADVTVAFAAPGNRGYWGDFLYAYKNIIKEGLVGGTLTDSWPLLNPPEKKPKLEYRGIKKIGSKSLHEIKYVPRGSSDLEISLFFDTESFQHVRTEYTRVVTAGLGTGVIGQAAGSPGRSQGGAVDASGQQRPTRYKMVEEFSDFKQESGLTLPHTYKVALELDTARGTLSVDWEFILSEFAFNQAIPPSTFNVK